MILHSIKSIIRTPKKTLLFLFLIALLSMFLSIGAGMFQSADNMIRDADETFTTVIELNYLGDRSDDEEAFYERMNRDLEAFNFDKLEEHPDIISVNKESSALAYIDEKQINQSLSILNDYVIIEVFRVRPFDEIFYQATINKVHFGKTMRENTYVMIKDIDEFGSSIGYEFIDGHKYLLIGKKSAGQTPTPIISLGLPEGIEGFRTVIDLEEEPEYYDSEEGKRLFELAEAFNIVNKSLPVTLVSSLEASEPYFNRDMIVSEGRIFNEEEYQEGNNKVIMISKNLANFYKIKQGDILDLKLHYASTGFGLSDYMKNYSFSEASQYEVVGIFDNKYDNRFNIYMPMADWIEQDYHSVTLARYIVINGSGNTFIETNKENLPVHMDFTLYDQGYEEAIKPIEELKDTAILLLILGGLSGIIILLLFSYLYVYKQGDTLINMLALGAGKKRTISYILFGSILLVCFASSIGSFISSGLISKTTNNVFEKMINLYGKDMRYSERALGVQLEYTANVSINYWIPVFITLLMLITSFILLYSLTIFIIYEERYKARKMNKKSSKRLKVSIKQKDSRKHKASKKLKKKLKIQKVSVNKEQDVLFGRVRPIPLKFALVSIIRNTGRSLIVPILTFVLSVFLVFLSFLSNLQQDKRATVYERIPVNAYYTTFKNETRDIGGLRLQFDIYRLIDPDYSYRMEWSYETYEDFIKKYTCQQAYDERNKLLKDSEFFKEMYLYTSIHYEYMGISKTKDGVEDKELPEVPNVRKHKDAFGYDWFLEAIKKMPRLAYADDLRYTPDFFGSVDAEVEFLSGHSFDSLRLTENVGMISRNLASKEGINLGDTIRITAWSDYSNEAVTSVIDVEVVGIYEQGWRSDVIYLPWIMSYDHDFYVDFGYPTVPEEIVEKADYRLWNEFLPRNVRSATFRLKNTENLDSFREYLDSQGYSEAGKIKVNRHALVVQDKNLEETINTLDNYIRLMDILIPIMLILFGVIGFIVSYLLIRHRLNELAIMRSMGAERVHVFLSFFIEQLILFVIGMLPVLIFGIVFPEYFIYYGVSLGYYIISYLAGTAVALLVLGRTKLHDILFSRE
ncbi:MAG: FtsX-like permease family protein [Clostridiales bacterium]|nr:FtsX-like permease family protein [Clostridiales bacterium]